MDTIKMFKLVTGEMLITKISSTRKDGGYELSYPLIIVPIPNQSNSIGFTKFMPFSDYTKPIVLFPQAIAVDSDGDKQMGSAYEQQVQNIKSQESGIIMPGKSIPKDILKNGAAKDFSKLNL